MWIPRMAGSRTDGYGCLDGGDQPPFERGHASLHAISYGTLLLLFLSISFHAHRPQQVASTKRSRSHCLPRIRRALSASPVHSGSRSRPSTPPLSLPLSPFVFFPLILVHCCCCRRSLHIRYRRHACHNDDDDDGPAFPLSHKPPYYPPIPLPVHVLYICWCTGDGGGDGLYLFINLSNFCII